MTDTNNFPPFQLGGQFIDLDALRNDEYTSIAFDHKKIHDGNMWGFSHFAGTVTAGGTVQVTYVAGTITPHVIWDVAAGASAQIKIVQNATLTGGTALPIHNRKLDTAGSSLMSAKHSGTIDGGTMLLNTYLPGGSNKAVASANGGASRGANEWIIPVAGTITLQIVGISAADGASINCEFYEETE